jgi:acyl-CoA dehydrogenase
VGHVVRNLFRSVGLSVTRGHLACAPSGTGPVKHYYRKLAWASASFAIMADVAMGMLGGQLKFREQLTGRFADILSWMYLGTAVLRRWDAEGRRKEDLPFVHFSMETAFMNIQRGFDGIFQNFRPFGLTWFFRGVLGTWSMLNRFTAGPNDKLTHRVSVLIQTPGEQRSRICESGIFIPTDASKDHVARLEKTLLAVKAAEATNHKVRAAVKARKIPKIKGPKLYEEALSKGVISKEEFDLLAKSEEMRWDAIQVDEFTLEQYKNRA